MHRKNMNKYWTFLYNKDHQKIMLDPMFLIVHNFRLFLTAVTWNGDTPTNVTPTEVILPEYKGISLNLHEFK